MQMRDRAWWAVLVVIILAVALRLVHLDSDPVYTFIPKDVGYHVDEGYKTLSPRNLALFGATHWNEFDEYRGWMRSSPVTQWAFYAAFSRLGVTRSSARLVNVALFGVFLLAAAAFFRSRYPAGVALLGVILLATDQALFHFSRVAIFEIPLVTFVFGGMFLSATLLERRFWLGLLVLLLVAIVASVGVKMSALTYLLPPIAALAAAKVLKMMAPASAYAKVSAALSLLVLAAVLAMTSGVWLPRVSWTEPFRTTESLLLHPMYQLSPLAMSLAYLALIDIWLRGGATTFRENPFLLMIASVAVVVPVILAFFEYNPPRYYVVVVPASLLVVVEWLWLRKTGFLEVAYTFSAARLAAVALACLPLAGSLLGFSGIYMIPALPFVPQGSEAGFSASTLKQLYPAAALGLSLLAWSLWRHGSLARSLPLAVLSAVALHLFFSVKLVAESLIWPSYAVKEIGWKMDLIVADGESVAGDWAPFMALDSDIPVLYLQPGLNDSDRISLLRPTYFLNSNTNQDVQIIQQLRGSPMTMREPIPLGTVFGKTIELIRLDHSGDT